MDHQLLRTPRVRKGERGQDSGRPEPSNTEDGRRNSTTDYAAQRPHPQSDEDDLARDECFSDLPAPSLTSIPTHSCSSWDTNSVSDGEDKGGRTSRRDRRKYVEATTPTLVDEEDVSDGEEEEMVSLEQERLRRSRRDVMKDEMSLRRTPGARMYASTMDAQRGPSLRRTPGASAMHRSSTHPIVSTSEVNDAAILGFGLTLSTPVGTSIRSDSKRADTSVKSSDSYSSSSSSESPSSRVTGRDLPQAPRPPRAPYSAMRTQDQRESLSYTPAGWTLSKNPHLEVNSGAFSPNTLRLTEDLDNLLHEEDENTGDALHARGHLFRGQGENTTPSVTHPTIEAVGEGEEVTESWTDSYIFDSDGGDVTISKAAKSTGGKSRRGKNDSTRRGRGGDSGRDYGTRHLGQSRDTEERPHPQHPKPVRHMQSTPMENNFTMGGFIGGESNQGVYYRDNVEGENRSAPRPFNFGGAFVPPSKEHTGNFRRFVPSPMRNPNYDSSFAGGAPTHPEDHPFHPSGTPGVSLDRNFQSLSEPHLETGHNNYQYSGFQPSPSMHVAPHPHGHMSAHAHSNQMQFPSHMAAMNYSNPMFGPTSGMSHNMTMGFQPMGPYSMGHSRMPPSMGQNYIPMPAHHHPAQQFPQPSWSQMMPMHYPPTMNQREPVWHPVDVNRGWGAGDAGYGLRPPGTMDSRMQMTPSPQFPSWIESEFQAEAHHYPSQHIEPNQTRALSPCLPEKDVFPAASESPLEDKMGAFPTAGSVPVQARDGEELVQHQLRKGKHDKKPASRKQRDPASIVASTQEVSSDGVGSSSWERDAKTDTIVGSRKKGVPTSPKTKPNKIKESKLSDVTTSKAPLKPEGHVDESVMSLAGDQVVDGKRLDLVESPASRSAFKDFYRRFRLKERSSFKEAEEFALQTLKEESLPDQVHWRVYLELADLAKRSNRFVEARTLYRQVCQLQPYASQGWLEHSKLEEECGHLNRCSKILHKGLVHCEFSENLLARAIKHEEKMGNLNVARQLLARLKHVGIEKVWRTVLEGALLEARAGNFLMARRVLKYLMHHVPWYGPLYLEAYRLDRDLGRNTDALSIVEKGLKAIPRYGPLWFGAFHLCESLDLADKDYRMPRTTAMIQRASRRISRELVWKVHLDAAQILERAAIELTTENPEISLNEQLTLCRQRFAMTVLSCPPNLCWKVWLASGRMELSAGNPDKARILFLRAQQVVPEKGKAATLLECARLEEFVGKTDLARAILCKSRHEFGSDWKVWLESVLLEVRSGQRLRAIVLAKRALEIHCGTGRLWASLVQLRYGDGGEEAQISSLKRALRAVPKSGEVWCEGGRIHLNPFSKLFDLVAARRNLFFATRFTPQYGDSFLETLKLELLEQWIAPMALKLWESMEQLFVEKIFSSIDQGYGVDPVIIDVVKRAACLIRLASVDFEGPINKDSKRPELTSNMLSSIKECLSRMSLGKHVDNSELELRCANADPNYGLLWFHCRRGPTQTARAIISRGREIFVHELAEHSYIYVAALVRRFAIMVSLKHEKRMELLKTAEQKELKKVPSLDVETLEGWERRLEARLRSSPSVESIIATDENDEAPDMFLLESSMSGSDFVTGLVELNTHRSLESLSLIERRKSLFGSDALLS